MTIRETLARVRDCGLTASWRPHVREFRINLRGGTEATAYYTSSPEDAVATAQAMARVATRARA